MKNKIKQFVKDHKKIIIAGTTVVIVGGLVYTVRTSDSFAGRAIKAAQNRNAEIGLSQNILVGLEDDEILETIFDARFDDDEKLVDMLTHVDFDKLREICIIRKK